MLSLLRGAARPALQRVARASLSSAAAGGERAEVVKKGTVKWFNSTKGYGFIQSEAPGNDVFVHFSAIESPNNEYRVLVDQEPVEYTLTEDKSGRLTADRKSVV